MQGSYSRAEDQAYCLCMLQAEIYNSYITVQCAEATKLNYAMFCQAHSF